MKVFIMFRSCEKSNALIYVLNITYWKKYAIHFVLFFFNITRNQNSDIYKSQWLFQVKHWRQQWSEQFRTDRWLLACNRIEGRAETERRLPANIITTCFQLCFPYMACPVICVLFIWFFYIHNGFIVTSLIGI